MRTTCALYNTRILVSTLRGGKGDDKLTNIRRENKLYSYEDQLAEIELRKEAEKRKEAKGINVEPKLTKQQQEAKQAQLEKESEIREKTKGVIG